MANEHQRYTLLFYNCNISSHYGMILRNLDAMTHQFLQGVFSNAWHIFETMTDNIKIPTTHLKFGVCDCVQHEKFQ